MFLVGRRRCLFTLGLSHCCALPVFFDQVRCRGFHQNRIPMHFFQVYTWILKRRQVEVNS